MPRPFLGNGMSDQAISTDVAVNTMIQAIQVQPGNVLSILEQQVPAISRAIDREVDEYNGIVAMVESRDADILKLNDEITRLTQIIKIAESTDSPKTDQLRESLANLTREHEAAVKQHSIELANLQQQIKNHKSLSEKEIERLSNRLKPLQANEAKLRDELHSAQKDLKALRALNPERVAKKNKELQKSLADKTKMVKKLDTSLTSSAKELERRADKIKSLVSLIQEMNVEVETLRERVNRYDGNVSKQVFEGKNGLQAYIYDFCWGLTTKSTDDNVKTVCDFDWHLEVRTNLGIGVIVSVTDWLVPICPLCAELKRDWPSNINDALEAIIAKRSETSHPHLIQRRDWSQQEDLDNVPGLTKRQITLLKASKFHSVYAVCHISPERLTKLAKGLGPTTCQTVYRHCRNYVADWESQNWTREQRGLI